MKKYIVLFMIAIPFLTHAMDEKIKDLDKGLQSCLQWCNNQHTSWLVTNTKPRVSHLQDLQKNQFCAFDCATKYLGQIIVMNNQPNSQDNNAKK